MQAERIQSAPENPPPLQLFLERTDVYSRRLYIGLQYREWRADNSAVIAAWETPSARHQASQLTNSLETLRYDRRIIVNPVESELSGRASSVE